MKIAVLEKINITEEQVKRLNNLGNVSWYESSKADEAKQRILEADVVVVDWIDPSTFILSMKTPSLLALMSTGYDWIQHRSEAKERGILVSNVPGYATEAVAEHLIGLMLNVARKSSHGDREIRKGNKRKGYLEGIELKGRRLGIIGLGRIGSRVAEIAKCLGMEVVTNNRHPKSCEGIADLTLDDLLSTSDIVSISCPLNEASRGMLNKSKLSLMKPGSLLVGTTWGIVVLEDLIKSLSAGTIMGVGFDVAIEASEISLPSELLTFENVVLTPHIGYNTVEAKIRQADICISNIEAFLSGKPINIIN